MLSPMSSSPPSPSSAEPAAEPTVAVGAAAVSAASEGGAVATLIESAATIASAEKLRRTPSPAIGGPTGWVLVDDAAASVGHHVFLAPTSTPPPQYGGNASASSSHALLISPATNVLFRVIEEPASPGSQVSVSATSFGSRRSPRESFGERPVSSASGGGDAVLLPSAKSAPTALLSAAAATTESAAVAHADEHATQWYMASSMLLSATPAPSEPGEEEPETPGTAAASRSLSAATTTAAEAARVDARTRVADERESCEASEEGAEIASTPPVVVRSRSATPATEEDADWRVDEDEPPTPASLARAEASDEEDRDLLGDSAYFSVASSSLSSLQSEQLNMHPDGVPGHSYALGPRGSSPRAPFSMRDAASHRPKSRENGLITDALQWAIPCVWKHVRDWDFSKFLMGIFIGYVFGRSHSPGIAGGGGGAAETGSPSLRGALPFHHLHPSPFHGISSDMSLGLHQYSPLSSLFAPGSSGGAGGGSGSIHFQAFGGAGVGVVV